MLRNFCSKKTETEKGKEKDKMSTRSAKALDDMFYMPIEALLKLTLHDLRKRQDQALLLANCLSSVMEMKKNKEVKQ